MTELPIGFCERMKRMLGAEYETFLASYDKERKKGLRVNSAKIARDEFLQMSHFRLEPIPWAKDGFFYEEEDRPGKHVFHEAGLYYIQEPSAMSVAELAEVKPGERVLDLCAAPGGKSTQLAAAMRGEGLIVCNEIHPARAKILSQNIERMGIPNALVTNESPDRLSVHFPEYFDKIVTDAPCSGEGMFRKEEAALTHWSQENVDLCAARQDEILDEAAKMLKPGGRLVYSTCTFAPEEDEGSIARFLMRHPEFHVANVATSPLFSKGSPAFADYEGGLPATEGKEGKEGKEPIPDEILSQIPYTFRLWPHLLDGEGHYAAVLIKDGGESLALTAQNEDAAIAGGKKKKGSQKKGNPKKAQKSPAEDAMKLYREFEKQFLTTELSGEPLLFGEQLYLMPEEIDLKGIRVLRPGLHVGTILKGRFEPSHALALALSKEEAKNTFCLKADSAQADAYLRGESLMLESADGKGWTLILADGYSVGWGKQSGGTLKNHYPKGLRRG